MHRTLRRRTLLCNWMCSCKSTNRISTIWLDSKRFTSPLNLRSLGSNNLCDCLILWTWFGVADDWVLERQHSSGPHEKVDWTLSTSAVYRFKRSHHISTSKWDEKLLIWPFGRSSVIYLTLARICRQSTVARERTNSNLVDPASSHTLVSKIKPCMCKYKRFYTVKLRTAHYISYSLFDK